MHIPSAISILGTDLRGLIPWIIKLKQVKLRRKRCFGVSLSFGRVWWGTDAYWQYKTCEILVPHHTFQWTMSHIFFQSLAFEPSFEKAGDNTRFENRIEIIVIEKNMSMNRIEKNWMSSPALLGTGMNGIVLQMIVSHWVHWISTVCQVEHVIWSSFNAVV